MYVEGGGLNQINGSRIGLNTSHTHKHIVIKVCVRRDQVETNQVAPERKKGELKEDEKQKMQDKFKKIFQVTDNFIVFKNVLC